MRAPATPGLLRRLACCGRRTAPSSSAEALTGTAAGPHQVAAKGSTSTSAAPATTSRPAGAAAKLRALCCGNRLASVPATATKWLDRLREAYQRRKNAATAAAAAATKAASSQGAGAAGARGRGRGVAGLLRACCGALFCLNTACCLRSACRKPGGCCARCCPLPDVEMGAGAGAGERRRSQARALARGKSMTASNKDLGKLDAALIEHNGMMRGAIPVLPMPLAWFCLVVNVFVPGLGTLSMGLFCLCVGKPRFSATDTVKARLGAFCLDTLVAAGQLFTVLFCLVGWGWSIWWGVICLRIAKKYKRIQLAERAAATRPAAITVPGETTGPPPRPVVLAGAGAGAGAAKDAQKGKGQKSKPP